MPVMFDPRLCAFAVAFAVCLPQQMAFADEAGAATAHRPPEQGGPRRFQVTAARATVFAAPSPDSAVLAEHMPGDLLSNLGCDSFAGAVWCKVAGLGPRTQGYLPAAQIEPARGPDGQIPTGRDDSRARARAGDFDARIDMPCAQEKGQALGRCDGAIARSGGGDATLVATFPNGFARQLYFTHGAFIRGSATMSGVGTDTEWTLAEGLYRIRVDDQRFEIPERFILGQ